MIMIIKEQLHFMVEIMPRYIAGLRNMKPKGKKVWKTEILNSFIWIDGKRVSNGPVEGKNSYIKKILFKANGFVNFERARNKIMYSQNHSQRYSVNEKQRSIKRKGKPRGKYKKSN